jgi:hypothetical protein
MITEKTVYITSDGQQFATRKDAEHEQTVIDIANALYELRHSADQTRCVGRLFTGEEAYNIARNARAVLKVLEAVLLNEDAEEDTQRLCPQLHIQGRLCPACNS